MLCAITVRKLKAGTYQQFRKAWNVDPWPQGWTRAYHVRSVDDENEVMSFGFFDGTLEQLEKSQETSDYASMRARTAPFEQSVRLDGLYEVLEEITPQR